MNPFNIKRFKTVFINFDHLDMPNEQKEIFIDKVVDAFKEKFSNVNITITDKIPLLDKNFKEIIIHNNENIDNMIGYAGKGDVGYAEKSAGIAEVNVNDVKETMGLQNISDIESLDKLASGTGTLGAHETGHLLLPTGHSSEGANLMNSNFDSELISNGGKNVSFTAEQTSFMNSGIETPEIAQNIYSDENFFLTHLEGSQGGVASDNITNAQDFVMEAGILSQGIEGLSSPPVVTDFGLEVAGSEVWGSFEPDSIASLEGLGEIGGAEGFSEMMDISSISDIDIGSLVEVTDGLFDGVSDLFEGIFDFVGELI